MTAAAMIITTIAITAGTEITKTMAEEQAFQAEEENLRTQELEEQSATNQKKIQSDEQLRHVLGEQAAFMGESGLTPASFQPISIGDMEKFAEEEDAINLNLQFKENAINSQISEIDAKKSWAPIINMFEGAEFVWNSSAIKLSKAAQDKAAQGSTQTAPDMKISKDNPVKVTTVPRFSGLVNNYINDLLEGK